MQVLKNLLNSEKAVANGVLFLGMTYLLFSGQIAPQEWLQYSTILAGVYTGGKAIQGGAAQVGKKIEERSKKDLESLQKRISEQNEKIDELVRKLPKESE